MKNFANKKIKIREISKKDLKNVKKFQDFINSLVEEDAQINMNKKKSLKEEIEWLKGRLEDVKKKQGIFLLAQHDGLIVGTTSISLRTGRQNHVGEFGITVRNGYRVIGLGTYLAKEIIKLAKKKLKPRPKIIRLSVYATNKPAIEFYKNLGFKEVAKIPKQGKVKGKLVDEVIMLKYL